MGNQEVRIHGAEMLDRTHELPDRIEVIQAWCDRGLPGEILRRSRPGVYLRRDGTAGPPEWVLRLHWGHAFNAIPQGQREMKGVLREAEAS